MCSAIFFIPQERAILLVKCDFPYSCAAADKISTDLRCRAVPLIAELLVLQTLLRIFYVTLVSLIGGEMSCRRNVHVVGEVSSRLNVS